MAKKSSVGRSLSEIEIDYIKNNYKTSSVDDMAKKMPEVNKKEIEAFFTHQKETNSKHQIQSQEINTEDQFIASNLMAKREGITIMTPQASELADARRTLRITTNPNFTKENSDKIHVIKK